MKWIYKLLAFLSNFSIGLTAPILSLMLCRHGCSLRNIGLAVIVFSITVTVTEVPSGVFADMYGRKLSFVASPIAGALSACIMLFSHSFVLTAVGLCLMGLSTAFASGSLDALAVEDTVRQKGKSAMTKTVASFLTFQCAGLACGALIGGFLPNNYESGRSVLAGEVERSVRCISLRRRYSTPAPHISACDRRIRRELCENDNSLELCVFIAQTLQRSHGRASSSEAASASPAVLAPVI